MKTVDRLIKRFSDRLEPMWDGDIIWNEGDDGWWANLKKGWKCTYSGCGSCHERTLRDLERALNAAKFTDYDPDAEG